MVRITRNKLLKQIAEAKLLGYDIKLTKTVWKRGCDFASPFPEENGRLPESPVLPDSFALVHPNSVDLKASNYGISLPLTYNIMAFSQC